MVCSYCKKPGDCVRDSVLSDYVRSKEESIFVSSEDLSAFDDTNKFECGSDTPRVFQLWEFYCDHDPFACEEYMTFFEGILPSDSDDEGSATLYSLNDGTLDEHNDVEKRWMLFNKSIRHDKRFFNADAKCFCEDLFSGSLDGDSLFNRLIYRISINDSIYRARIAYSTEEIEEIENDPVGQLGAVPKHLASSQRMTPAGVSSFYGAFDRKTCLSELRPIVGDAVISAEFRALKDINLLDLDALSSLDAPSDYFSNSYLTVAHARIFYKELIFQLTRPSSRNGYHDYLATQYIFEYLRSKFGSQINGLKYSSIQNNGKTACIALFPEYSKANEGFIEFDEFDIFSGDKPAIYWVPKSLRYHRIKQAQFCGSEYGSHYDLTMNDRIMRLLFPSERY